MKKIIYFVLLIFILCTVSVSAHDMEYGYTHNHNDYFVIASVDSFDETAADITVVNHIISTASCGDNNGSHIPPKKMSVRITDRDYEILKTGCPGIAAVIDKRDNGYTAVKIYGTDSTDYKTLNIISPKMSDKDNISGDDAAINDFINSGGIYNDFVFTAEYGVKRRYGGKETVIYTPEDGYIATRDNTSHISKYVWHNIWGDLCVILITAVMILWMVRKRKKALCERRADE